jgi:hypothetical protein
MNDNNEKLKPINLKVSPDVREKFKQITHQQKTSMQDVLYAFVHYYIQHPEKFNIGMQINEGIQI